MRRPRFAISSHPPFSTTPSGPSLGEPRLPLSTGSPSTVNCSMWHLCSTTPASRAQSVRWISPSAARPWPERFLGAHDISPEVQEVVTNAIALHHTPGVGLDQGPEA